MIGTAPSAERTAILACALAVSAALAPLSLGAQEIGGGALTVEQRAPVCLASVWRDVPQVAETKRGQALQVVVAEADAPALEKRGFVRTECATADLATTDRRGEWRDQVCEMAAYGNEAVQNQFERALGARPAVLCGSAELVAGQWRGPKAETKQD